MPRLPSSLHSLLGRTCPQKCKSPTGINPVGLLVLATSYSRTAYRRTTIGAAAFHCRVRNGNGWGHCASVTRSLSRNRGTNFWCVIRNPRFEIRNLSADEPILDSRFNDSRFTLSKNAGSLISTYGAVIRDS